MYTLWQKFPILLTTHNPLTESMAKRSVMKSSGLVATATFGISEVAQKGRRFRQSDHTIAPLGIAAIFALALPPTFPALSMTLVCALRQRSSAMYAVTVLFQIAPAHRAAAIKLMRENAQASLGAEAGCQRFDVCTDPERPDNVFLYELYDDSAAFDDHLQSPHFKAFDAAVAKMIVTKEVACFARVDQ